MNVINLSPFVAGWLALACTIAGLAIYRKLVSTREDDTLHVLDNESHVLEQQPWPIGWTRSITGEKS